MLSILIPTYNYDVFPLVENLQKQAIKANITFEVLVFDDASQNHFNNSKINELNNCSFTILHQNIGRSAIRNLLAKTAKYEWLLFLDADVLPVTDTFITVYTEQIKSSNFVFFSGGIAYKNDKPSKDNMLRWKYGHHREAISFEQRLNGEPYYTIVNSLFHKSVFDKVQFDEKIKLYGYEDVMFITDALQYFQVGVVDNPVFHLDNTSSSEFLDKTKSALTNLHFLISTKQIDVQRIKIARVYMNLKKYKLHFFMGAVYKAFHKLMERQLKGGNPSLFLFDIYRLGYLSTIN